MKALFNLAKLTFSITSREQFSRTIAEAILSETALILNDIEPYRYLVNQFNFRVDLVDITESKTFGELIEQYIKNPTKPEFSKEKNIVRDLFDFESKYDEFRTLYQKLIEDAHKN
jgi:hypothetical protein